MNTYYNYLQASVQISNTSYSYYVLIHKEHLPPDGYPKLNK